MSSKYIKLISFVILMLITVSSLCNKNKLPNTPIVPSGPTSGYVDSSYTFTSSATDPDADNVALRFYWGGTDTSTWSGFVQSGNTVTMSHTWSLPGPYSVKAQAMDEDSVVSVWSAGHAINIISRFVKTFGGSDNDYGSFVQPTANGGYIITGYTYSFGAGNADVYLIKTNINGDTAWTKTFGGSNNDEGIAVQPTSDGGYIIAGYTYSSGTGGDVYLIKTDASGNQVWYKTIGGSQLDYAYSVAQTSDGGYIITGGTYSYGTDGDVYLVKTNASGNQVWANNFGGSLFDVGWSVQEITGGGYIIAGSTALSAANSNIYLIKTDANGNQVWTKNFGGSSNDYGYSVAQTSDGGYIIAGRTYSYGAGGDVYLIKTDTGGTTDWTKYIGGSGADIGYSIQQTPDGGYIITGVLYQSSAGEDVYLVKTFANGNIDWSKTFGGAQNEHGHCVAQTSDGGYIIVGHTNTYGAGQNDFYLIKTDASGNAE